jgi:hypothetical protein
MTNVTTRRSSMPPGLHPAGWRDRHQFHCPGCGDVWVHFSLDHYDHPDMACPLGTQGNWVALRFWCETCPANWRFVVGFHKGNTFAGTVRDEDYHDLEARWAFGR